MVGVGTMEVHMAKLILGCIMMVTTFVIGQGFSDVSDKDPAFGAIQHSIQSGYLTVLDNNTFLPDGNVTRKEMALMLEKLDAIANKGLTKNDIVELKQLSKTFKGYLQLQQNTTGSLSSDIGFIKTEQQSVQYDMTKIQDLLQQRESQLKQQEVLIWVAIGVGILGVVI